MYNIQTPEFNKKASELKKSTIYNSIWIQMSNKFNFSFGRTSAREHTVHGKSHAAYAFSLNSTSVMDICLYFPVLFCEGMCLMRVFLLPVPRRTQKASCLGEAKAQTGM
jgi:hypothetical protein